MKYIGNCREWIKQEWVDRILNTDGDPCPLHQPENQQGSLEKQKILYSNFLKGGWNELNFVVNMYTPNKTSDLKGLDVTMPPLITTEGMNFHWWFVKTNPGQLTHWHYDPHTVMHSTAKRYWVAMQDYEPGHVFIWENGGFLSEYKSGDVYEFSEADLYHGVVNMGLTPRFTFQATVYEFGDEVPKAKYYEVDESSYPK